MLALLTSLTVALFPTAFLQGKSLLPADLIYFYSPWREQFPNRFSQPSNWILFDEMFEFVPWRAFAREKLLHGAIPLWDAGGFCGFPFVGVLQTAVFYPLDLLLLPLPMAAYPAWRGLLHMLLAGSGMYWFCRLMPLRRSAALLGSVVFAFSGFIVAWFGHPHCKVASWLPWVMLLTRQSSRTGSRAAVGGLALALVGQLLAGHVETSVHVLFAAGLYSILLLATEKRHRLRFLRRVALAHVLALALAQLQFLPFIEYLANSSAFDVRKHGVVVQPYFPPYLALCLLAPKFFGCNADNNYVLSEFNSNEVMAGYSGVLPFGLAALGLLSLGRKRRQGRQEALHLAVLWIFSLAVVFRLPPVYQLVHLIPGMKMSYNFRFLLVTVFATAGLAAWSCEHLAAGSIEVRRWRMLWLLPPILLAVGMVFFHARFERYHLTDYNLRQAALFMLLWLLLPLVVKALRSDCMRPAFRIAVVLIVCYADLWLNGYGYNRAFDPVLLFPPLSILSRLPPQTEPYRVLPLGYTLPPHSGSVYGIFDIRGNDALTPLCIEQYLALADPRIHAPDLLPAMRLFQFQRFHHPLLDGLNLKFLITPQNTDLSSWMAAGDSIKASDYPLTAEESGVALHGNLHARPRAYITGTYTAVETVAEGYERLQGLTAASELHHFVVDPQRTLSAPNGEEDCGRVKIASYGAARVEMEAEAARDGLLVLADTFFPGWSVTIDGERSRPLRVNHALRGAPINRGRHAISFNYEPMSYRLGLFISCCALMMIGGLAVAAFRTCTKQSN